MPPRKLAEPMRTLEDEIIATMTYDNHEPKSVSDWKYCVRNLLKMFDVQRRPVSVELKYEED
jgi:hypothetical protein